MERRIPWFWIVLAGALLLLPTPAGRLLLDVIGGLTLTLLLLPLLAGGVALIGWQLLRRRLRTCPSCGFTTLGGEVCPVCGSGFGNADGNGTSSAAGTVSAGAFFRSPGSELEIDARDVTINVEATAVDGSGQQGPSQGARDQGDDRMGSS